MLGKITEKNFMREHVCFSEFITKMAKSITNESQNMDVYTDVMSALPEDHGTSHVSGRPFWEDIREAHIHMLIRIEKIVTKSFSE